MMHKFDWREVERDEYSRSEEPSFVKLTTRSYITAMGVAPDRVTDQAFTSLAAAVTQIAERISEGPDAGIDIPNFKASVLSIAGGLVGAIKSVSATFFDCG